MNRDKEKFPFDIGQTVSVVLKNKTLRGIVIDEYESNVFDEIDVWRKLRHAVLYKVKLQDGTEDTFYPYDLYPVMPTVQEILATIKIITNDYEKHHPEKKNKVTIGTISGNTDGVADDKFVDEPHKNF